MRERFASSDFGNPRAVDAETSCDMVFCVASSGIPLIMAASWSVSRRLVGGARFLMGHSVG